MPEFADLDGAGSIAEGSEVPQWRPPYPEGPVFDGA